MITRTEVRCALCGGAVARVDEHDRCEQCVLDVEGLATRLQGLEDFVGFALRSGLMSEQLREAFELCLGNRDGTLAGVPLARYSTGAFEPGRWQISPASSFIDWDRQEAMDNEIASLRRYHGLSLEALAAKLEVGVPELALWEVGAIPPRQVACTLAFMFGVALDYLLLGGRDRCARCSAPAPGNPERYERGWDVAGGAELVCPDCMLPGDLDWPSG